MAVTTGPNIGVLINANAGEEYYSAYVAFLRAVDGLMQACVIDKDLSAPPASPANGSLYIVGASATGAWAGKSGQLARYYTVGVNSPAWEFYVPKAGWAVRVIDEIDSNNAPTEYRYNGSTWVIPNGGSGSGSGFANPMTAAGDLIVGGTAGAATRLGHGTTGQVLTVQADGTLAWATSSGGGGGSGDFKADGSVAMTGALNFAPFAALNTSNTTADLSTVAANTIVVNSSASGTLVQSLGTLPSGVERTILAQTALVLQYSSALKTPGGVDLTLAAGDWITVMSTGGGNWSVTGGMRVDGSALKASSGGAFLPLAGGKMTGAINEATQVVARGDATIDFSTLAANTLLLSTSTGNPVSSFGTLAAGARRRLICVDGITITYSATGIITPGQVDLVLADGDVIEVESKGAGVWQVVGGMRKSGKAIVSSTSAGDFKRDGSVSMTGALNEAPLSYVNAANGVAEMSNATSNTVYMNGSGNVGSFGSAVPNGGKRLVNFQQSFTLVNSTQFALPGGANIVTAVGDSAEFVSLGGGYWLCSMYTKANGQPVVGGGSADPTKLPLDGSGKMTGPINEMDAKLVYLADATSIDAATGQTFYLLNGVTLTTFTNGANGSVRRLNFGFSGLVLRDTDNLRLIGGSSITAATGDWAEFQRIQDGNWYLTKYQRKDGTSLVGSPDATKIPLTQRGVANGVATLDAGGLVPAAQLPSYVDDVLEYATFSAFPATGETGKIYISDTPYTQNGVTSSQFRWSGSAYVAIVASPGSTDSVTEGSTNKYFTTARVLATVLSGLDTTSAAVVAATDTIISAVGKLQAQVTAAAAALAANVRGTVLTGLSTASATAVTATDTVLSALGKLQAQVAAAYTKASAIGTVSYSGGNTGAIIESGSNANGYYVKYADGTMQCFWLTGTITWAAANSGGITWTYPAVFDATNVTVWVQATPITNGPHAYNASAIVNSTTSATIYMGGTGAANGSCYCQATGRWRP